MIKGTIASNGIAIGKALKIIKPKIIVHRRHITNVDEELKFLASGLNKSKREVIELQEKKKSLVVVGIKEQFMPIKSSREKGLGEQDT